MELTDKGIGPARDLCLLKCQPESRWSILEHQKWHYVKVAL